MSQIDKHPPAVRIPAILGELDKAMISGDPAPLFDRYTAEDYIFTSPSGSLVRKSDVLRALTTGESRFTSYATSEILVRDYGPLAIVHGIAAGEGVNPGSEPFSGRHRFTSVWTFHEEDWRLVAWQATALS